jgi:hypothetical protein
VGTFLKADGMLLVTTCCQGGSVGVEALNLWGTATGGRLPSVEEMVGQLRGAGYRDVEAIRLTPGDSFHAFRARAGMKATAVGAGPGHGTTPQKCNRQTRP